MVEYKGNDTGWKSRTEIQRAGGDRSMDRSMEVLCTGFMGHPVAKGISEGEGLLCHSILHNSVTGEFKQVSLLKNKQLQNSSTINISSKS